MQLTVQLAVSTAEPQLRPAVRDAGAGAHIYLFDVVTLLLSAAAPGNADTGWRSPCRYVKLPAKILVMVVG